MEQFGSVPVFVHHCRRLQASSQPVDLLLCGFTVTGAALLCSELFRVPLAPFILQPSSIPSKEPSWRCVEEIQTSDSYALMSEIEHYFTSHSALSKFKVLTEGNTITHGLPKLRSKYGLKPARTWPTIMQQDMPVLMPFKPGTFEKPRDWPARFQLTDFIFLRGRSAGSGGGGGGGASLPERVDAFIAAARAAGRKLCLMTFSSMPVERSQYLPCVARMVREGAHPLAVVFVGPQCESAVSAELTTTAAALAAEGTLLEVRAVDFGVLFPFMDCFVVHGGLGTTVEALRMRKPIAITGLLLMDQRWWGRACERFGVGPPPVHISDFRRVCVEFVDKALGPDSAWRRAAEALDWGDTADDGVEVNVAACARLLEEGVDSVRAVTDEEEVLATRRGPHRRMISDGDALAGWGSNPSL